MGRSLVVFPLIFMVFFGGFSSVSAKPPPLKIVSGIVSNVASVLWKWLWSLQASSTTSKPAVSSSRTMVKFESGYTVETVFDGSKLGIEPYAVEVSTNGELFVLDSENSNVYRISMPLSRYSRPKLVCGSPEGYTGHVDGKLREARMNHPKGLTVDDRGNMYIADTTNMAIRKIGDEGVTTIAGGKWGRGGGGGVGGGGGHIDGPSEDAKFSDDFDIVYVGSSCSLLIIDRGNQAIREIQLHEDDCSEQHDSDFHLGVTVLIAAAFFGYMLALLQYRIRALFSSRHDSRRVTKPNMPISPYQGPPRSVRPPLIPPQGEYEKSEEGFFGSLGKLVVNTGSSFSEIFCSLFSSSRKKPSGNYQFHNQQLYNHHQQTNQWPMQESFVIPDEDEPPPPPPPPVLETRSTMLEKTYPKRHLSDQVRPCNNYNYRQMQHQQQQQQMQQQQNHRQVHHSSSDPRKCYEKGCEATSEIVFGAVQEQDGRREAVVIKAVDYADHVHDHQRNIRPRINYMGYSSSNGY